MKITELEKLAEKSQLEFFFSNGKLYVQRKPAIFVLTKKR